MVCVYAEHDYADGMRIHSRCDERLPRIFRVDDPRGSTSVVLGAGCREALVSRDEVLDDETAEERLGPTSDKRERVCCGLSGYFAESSSNRRTYLLMGHEQAVEVHPQ